MKKIIAIAGFLAIVASEASIASAGYFNTTPVVRCETQITKTLQIGSENKDVIILQQMLVNAGFLGANPNGYFGYQTRSAVRMFQVNNGILPTGVVGPATRNAVNERLCDTDLVDNTSYNTDAYDFYGYANGITYVSHNDPFVRVVSPTVTTPVVYATPQNTSYAVTSSPSAYVTSSANLQTTVSPSTLSQIHSTNIVYNPSTGYTYGIVPQSGSVTVSSPKANAVYREGDTVAVSWTTNNLQTSRFSILFESTITGKSQTVATISSGSYSFVLTKELLDAVCSGTCNNTQQGSFRVVVSTPTTDIAGVTSTLRAAIAPITVNRPLVLSQVSITTSKTPVNSGEIFKLFINIPTGASWDANLSGNYSVKIKAICPSSVMASIAGVPCGQDFLIPFGPTAFQQEIPAAITNQTWYKQDVIFQITVTNLLGQVIGVAETKVTANGAPISW